MQSFKEFLKENYDLTEEQFITDTSAYDKHIIEAEWESYIGQYIK